MRLPGRELDRCAYLHGDVQQGLLYMVEGLHYASGSRFPIVMMNANRSIAAPWNIYGDQRDSLAELESGWIQLYAENAPGGV